MVARDRDGVDGDPHPEYHRKRNEEPPAPSRLGDLVCDALAQGQAAIKLHVMVTSSKILAELKEA